MQKIENVIIICEAKAKEYNYLGGTEVNGKISILIADDNQEFSRTLSTYLENQEDMEVIRNGKRWK